MFRKHNLGPGIWAISNENYRCYNFKAIAIIIILLNFRNIYNPTDLCSYVCVCKR